MKTIKISALVFAFCISAATCLAQRDYSGICSLGDFKTDTKLFDIDTLRLNCSAKDLIKFRQYSGKLNSLNCLILQGDTDPETWVRFFEEIKTIPSVKSIVFNSNSFDSLPYGFENFYNNIQELTITDNDNVDYYQTLQQLRQLPNLKKLSLDVYSILDLPDSMFYLNNLSKIVLVNDDFGIVGRDEIIPPVVYDFSVNRTNNFALSVKYVSLAGAINGEEYEELSDYFKTPNLVLDTIVPSAFAQQLYVPQYKYVKPPIAGLDVERDTYAINPGLENILTYPSGTKILIPANAFVDKDGRAVTENVTVSYREFRDPVDFLVSGIPMKYDSGGTVNNFESAGMFELYASLEAQPLKLASGKQIKMNFVATSADSSYNFYSYNDSIGNWNYKSKPKVAEKSEKIKIKASSNAYTHYKLLLQSRPLRTDSTGLSQRFERLDYIYTARLDTNFSLKRFYSYNNGNTSSKRLTNLVKIVRVRKNREGDVVFKLKFDSDAHPELDNFNNVCFLLTDNISVNQFKKEFCYKKSYNDIRVYRNGNGVELKLKGTKQFQTVNAEIVRMNEKGQFKAIKNMQGHMVKYEKQLKRKERDFKRGRRNSYCPEPPVMITDPLELSQYAFKGSKKYMSKEERKMNYETWINYYNQVMENERLAVANMDVTSENLVRSLVLDDMGIFNCDQIQRLQNPVEVFADYNKNNDSKVSPQSVYIIDKKINAVLQYNGYRGYGPGKIAFSNNPDAQNVLLAINGDGSMAIYRCEKFKQNIFTDKTKFTFRVEELGNRYSSVGELKKSLGL